MTLDVNKPSHQYRNTAILALSIFARHISDVSVDIAEEEKD